MTASILDRYGGFVTISEVVMVNYDKALDSNVIGYFFDDIDVAVWIDH